jgi:lysophospholipase L1-like esterase
MFRLAVRLSWIVLFGLGLAPPATSQTGGGGWTVNAYAPDQLAYSNDFCKTITTVNGVLTASFDRELTVNAFCGQEKMSPSVRCHVRTRARYVRFELAYRSAGADCTNASRDGDPINWEFGLELDQELLATGASNPLYQGITLPNFAGIAPASPWILWTAWVDLLTLSGGEFEPHDVTLIWPAGANVDLLGVELKGVNGITTPTLLTPIAPPTFRVGFFGDSITHGIYASHVTKTHAELVARQRGWGLVNLGYAGRRVVASDGTTAGFDASQCAGQLGAPLDLLYLAIGSNDFNLGGLVTPLDDFEDEYEDWLDAYRLESASPIVVVTAIPRLADECWICTRSLEQYRERIRSVVERRDDGGIYLLEGRDLVPASAALYDGDGLHPNDAGFDAYASGLLAGNLVRNASFALKALVCCSCTYPAATPCPEDSTDQPYLWDALVGTSGITVAGTNRLLSLAPGAQRGQIVHGLGEDDDFIFSAWAQGSGSIQLEFLDAADGLVSTHAVPVSSTGLVQVGLTNSGPDGAVRCRVRIVNSGTSAMLVDDLDLTVASY